MKNLYLEDHSVVEHLFPRLTNCSSVISVTKLSDKELVSALETEKGKLLELSSQAGRNPLPEGAVISPVENWDAMLPEVSC